ncbi:MAG: hypothetical protein GF384_05815 [Elusimicrobia bacterium]|nr:hypothetical protein [Elusimicrobiota bacterium]MBD3412275.1 hypothetical protein [Elusimicrobiota bacterium]
MKRLILPLCGLVIIGGFLIYRIYRTPCQPYPETAVVRTVIDGDTVIFNSGHECRYIGIDTPEVHIRKGSDWEYQPALFSLKAKKRNEELVLGQTVQIEYDREQTDKYGRLLAYLYVDEIMVNETLLSEGLGFLLVIPPNVRYVSRFHEAVHRAYTDTIGIWDRSVVPVISAADASHHMGKLVRIRERITEIVDAGPTMKLILDPHRVPHENCRFVIFNNTIRLFEELKPLDRFKNSLVEVTGFIKDYNGPEIIINSPEQISLVSEL